MGFLQGIFLESPFRLGIFSFLLFAVVLFARQRWTGKPARYALPITLLIILLLFTAQRLIVTERKHIMQSLDAFVAAIADKNQAGIAEAISAEYECDELDRDGILGFLERAIASTDIYDTRYHRRDVVIDGNRAEMILSATATVRFTGRAGEWHRGRWRLGWLRVPDGWQITSIRPELIDGAAITSLRRLAPYVR